MPSGNENHKRGKDSLGVPGAIVISGPERGLPPPIDTQLGSPSSPRTHDRNGSDPTYLSPHSIPSSAGGLGASPVSPTPSTTSTALEPPSPTLSAQSSVMFNTTSLALRDNKVDLLSPNSPHRRSPSNSSSVTNASSNGHTTDVGKEKDSGAVDEPLELPPIADDESLDITPFSYHPRTLASLLDPKCVEALQKLGGVEDVMKGLGTHPQYGLSTLGTPIKPETLHSKSASTGEEEAVGISFTVTGPSGDETEAVPPASAPSSQRHLPETRPDIEFNPAAYDASLEKRQKVFGSNTLPSRRSKSLLELMWMAMKDKVLVILSIAAVIAFALGLFQDFSSAHVEGTPRVDWVEGVAIMVAILIVVVVGALNDYQKERQFRALNDKKEERTVKVIRDGEEQIIDVKDIVVGDIALLEPGEIAPVDGIFLDGHNVKCDESGATGESDAVRKMPYQDCISGEAHHKADCFIMSGSKIIEGVGRYLVVAVGQKSFNGRIMMVLRSDNSEDTPLQTQLNNLAELIAKLGSLAGLALFSALMIRFFVQLGEGDGRTSNEKGIAFVQILIISVTLIVVAVPEGLPLAWTLALAFATKKMTKENLLVRVLSSCESMSNASVICTDKTGTLTTNVMSVVAGSIGINAKFVRRLADNATRTNADEVNQDDIPEDGRKHPKDFSVDQTNISECMSPALETLFNEAICINSTAFFDTATDLFVGSKTETALLQFAKELGWMDYKKTRSGAQILQLLPFSSLRKAMGVVVRMPNGRTRLYVKGASEILTKVCTRHVVTSQTARRDSKTDQDVEVQTVGAHELDNISRTIIFYANQTLRTIALCYRDLESWPPANVSTNEENEVSFEDLACDLTLIAITGIEDPVRDGVREAVSKCHRAGVAVKMCTGDNALTARSIALQCGIFTAGGIIMEGPAFRCLNEVDMLAVLPRLQVLARSSPEDKQLLVESLKELGEIVGVTGDGTNDGPALKTAHVGFAMGIAGTEVAKEASDVILMDDNFASIVRAIMWGRCVNDAVKKFLQFQLATNVTAVAITFISAVASNSETSVLSAVQLLWINIIMDTFAALALATDPASESLLDRKPDKKSAPLFTTAMYKQILFQSLYQIIILLIFHFLGQKILGFSGDDADLIVQTTVFNIFVFAQIFNSINCRRLDNKINIFEGINRNWYFIGITLIEFVIQVLIVFVGGAAFQVTRIAGREWGISIALGFASIPIGYAVRRMPDEPFTRLFKFVRLLPKENVLPTTRANDTGEWRTTMEDIKENLGVFSRVRGGRLRASSQGVKRRFARKSKMAAGPKYAPSSIMAMIPSLVMASVAAPARASLSDPTSQDPSKSSAALWEGKIQIHPDTKPDDDAYKRWGTRPVTPS